MIDTHPHRLHPIASLSARALALVLAGLCLQAGEPAANTTETTASSNPLADVVLCRGKNVEVKRSRLDRAVAQFKANAIARGQSFPANRTPELEAMLLDRLVVTQLLMQRATPTDRTKGQELAAKFLAETKEQAGSDAAFQRQLMAMSFTEQELEDQILERAICEEVVERELRTQTRITDDQVRRYFEENADQLKRPEMVRVSHILLATVDPLTREEMSLQQKIDKRQLLSQIRERALAGEDFNELVKTYSEDPGAPTNKGEYIFAHGQMVAEFEAAAFSMEPGQISDIVTTRFGYHLIKFLQRIPAEPIEFAKVEQDIRTSLERREVQENLLPAFLAGLRVEAGLEYLNGATPPPPAESRIEQPSDTTLP